MKLRPVYALETLPITAMIAASGVGHAIGMCRDYGAGGLVILLPTTVTILAIACEWEESA